MTIKTIDQQRFDELTEWCRNRPEDAAARIAIAEGWEGTYPEAPKTHDEPDDLEGVEIAEIVSDQFLQPKPMAGTISAPKRFRVAPATSEARQRIIKARHAREIVYIKGVRCVIESYKIGMTEEFIACEVRLCS